MAAQIIDGKEISAQIKQQVRSLIQEGHYDTSPGLAVILVGSDPASSVYVRAKMKVCDELNISSFEHRLPEDVSEQILVDLIHKLNDDPLVNGILVQLPLPKHLDETHILAQIEHIKDVDGFHAINAGLLSMGSSRAIIPCTPMGCRILLKSACPDLSGKDAVVIGRSNIVGKPMANLLLQENCTVTIVHSRTKNIKNICRQADILVAAIGRAEMIDHEYIKEGAYIIDVGINRVEDPSRPRGYRLVGDVDFESAAQKAAAITPVPGGVGPMTIACLMLNTLICFYRKNGLDIPASIQDYL